MSFFQSATENLQSCLISSTMLDDLARQSGNGKVQESAALEIRNNSGKMVDV